MADNAMIPLSRGNVGNEPTTPETAARLADDPPGASYDQISGVGVHVAPTQLLCGAAVALEFRSVYQSEAHDLTIEQALDLAASLATACRSALTRAA